jgi:hypothetical protein
VSTAWAQKVDEGEDWKLISPAFKASDDLVKTDPKAAIQAWQQVYAKRGAMAPTTGSIVFAQVAYIYDSSLKDTERALATYDKGLEMYGDHRGAVELVGGKAKLLHRLGKSAEAEAVYKDNWRVVAEAGQSNFGLLEMRAAQALQGYVRILKGDDKASAAERTAGRDKVITMLQRAFVEMPAYLDDRKQGDGNSWSPYGWMYDELIGGLIDADRKDEALGWAKVYYMGCAFDAASIDRATRALGRAWTAVDDFGAIRTFAKAQEAAASTPTSTTDTSTAKPVTNPLTAVKLPAFKAEPAKLLKTRLELLQGQTKGAGANLGKLNEIIGLNLLSAASGDKAALAVAMNAAKQMMASDLKGTEGPAAVCRVFKAADLNTGRANAFISYLEGAEGVKNPMTAFFKEYETKTTSAG